MKRKVALTLALLLAAALAAGCAAGEDKPSAQLPNPVEEVDGPEDFLTWEWDGIAPVSMQILIKKQHWFLTEL